MALAEVGEVDVVAGVRNHVVDIVWARHALERLPGFNFAGRDIEPVNAGKAVVLHPDLAVDVRALRAHHIDLRSVDVFIALQRPELEGLTLAIELHDCRLVHIAEPQTAVAIAAQTKQTGREARLVFQNWKFDDLAGSGIKPAKILLAEAGIPDHAAAIDDYIMWRDGFPR